MDIEHTLVIRTDPARLWDLTIDIERWPDLTPTITSVERLDRGALQVGSRARLRQPRQRPAVWTVTRFEPERCFEWQTTVFGVVMTGRHLIEAVDGGTRNTLQVDLAGRGARVLGALAGRAMLAAITTENEGFRDAAEAVERAG